MRTGLSLQDIATRLEQEVATRKDYIAPQGAAEVRVVEGEVVVEGINGGPLGINPWAHQQFSDLLAIPRAYYNRMLAQQPELLAENLRTWLTSDGNTKRLFRTLNGKLRAVLSPKYRPLDNFDLANAILPSLMKLDFQIMSSELTETRMYIKGILPSLSDELPEGMTWGNGHSMVGRDGRLVAALVVSNSEVGGGTLKVEPSVFTTWCTNLAIMQQAAMRKYHVGRAGTADESFEVFRDETREADDRAFFLKVQDVALAAFREDTFKAAIAQIRESAKVEILNNDLKVVVDRTVKELALPEKSASGILGFLARGGDFTKWGLSSAITQVANGWESYEGATSLERAGGQVLALGAREWDRIVKDAELVAA